MQDEITTRLARTVGIELIAAEGRRAERERPNNMDAVDLAMRGWAILNQPLSLRRDREACELFDAALRLDDRNVEALIGLAFYHTNDVRTFASTNRDEQIRIAEKAITKALDTCSGQRLSPFRPRQCPPCLRRDGTVVARARARYHAGSQSSLGPCRRGLHKGTTRARGRGRGRSHKRDPAEPTRSRAGSLA